MNIRIFVYSLIACFCFQVAAMDQEQVMALIQHGSPEDIHQFAQSQCPTDSSFVMNAFRNVTLEAATALLVADKFETVSGKIVAGALGLLVAAEGVVFINGIATFIAQQAQQKKLFRYFMNIRKGIELRKKALDSGDSAEADRTEQE